MPDSLYARYHPRCQDTIATHAKYLRSELRLNCFCTLLVCRYECFEYAFGVQVVVDGCPGGTCVLVHLQFSIPARVAVNILMRMFGGPR